MNEHPELERDDKVGPAVIAADDTGMIRSEQLLVQADMAEQLELPES